MNRIRGGSEASLIVIPLSIELIDILIHTAFELKKKKGGGDAFAWNKLCTYTRDFLFYKMMVIWIRTLDISTLFVGVFFLDFFFLLDTIGSSRCSRVNCSVRCENFFFCLNRYMRLYNVSAWTKCKKKGTIMRRKTVWTTYIRSRGCWRLKRGFMMVDIFSLMLVWVTFFFHCHM